MEETDYRVYEVSYESRIILSYYHIIYECVFLCNLVRLPTQITWVLLRQSFQSKHPVRLLDWAYMSS